MEKALRHVFGLHGRLAEAEHVRIEDGPGAEARAEDVAVHADDAGDRPAVGVQGRGRVVRLGLDADEILVVEIDDAGVVMEDRPEVRPSGLEVFRGSLDISGEERVDDFLGAAFLAVTDTGREDLVLAVLAPGLGDHLEFDVRGFGREALGGPSLPGRLAAVIVPDGAHLVQRKEKEAVPGELDEFLVGEVRDREGLHLDGTRRHDVGIDPRETPTLPPISLRQNLGLFDEGVVQGRGDLSAPGRGVALDDKGELPRGLDHALPGQVPA